MSGCKLGMTTSGSEVPGEGVEVVFGGATGSIELGSQGVVVVRGRRDFDVLVVVVVVVVVVEVDVVVVVVVVVVVGMVVVGDGV